MILRFCYFYSSYNHIIITFISKWNNISIWLKSTTLLAEKISKFKKKNGEIIAISRNKISRLTKQASIKFNV